jgi:hypothetical protein
MGLLTVTVYSFRDYLARNILLTMSPSLVMNINPSLALSIVQLGKYVSGN